MSLAETAVTVVMGLAINECCEVSPWAARRLVRWSAHCRYAGNPERAEIRAAEWAALIDTRPGKIFKLLTACGFAAAALCSQLLPLVHRAAGKGSGGAVATLPSPDVGAIEVALLVRRADATFQRMCEATAEDALMAELSNLLHHVYRLRELCKRRLGSAGFCAVERSMSDLRAARAVAWVRNFDAHRPFGAVSLQGVYSGFYTATYGVLVWEPLSCLHESFGNHDRHLDYAAELEGKPVLDTLRRSFDALASLL